VKPDRFVLAAAAAVTLFGVFYAVFARVALHGFPFSGDEYSYLLQAQLFARGVLHAPAPAHPELLRIDHVILQPWVCSKYPPGTSALLALGVLGGAPWLVTPLEGVVALAAMAVAARRLLEPRAALLAVAMLGAAPLFAFQAASYFSHTATTMWLAIAFAAVVAWSCEGRAWRLVVAGLAIGCALVTRPLDAAIFAAALLSLRSVRAVALVAACVVPFVGLHFAYQAAQFGSPFTDGYTAYEPTFRAIYGARTAMPAMSVSNLLSGEQTWHRLDIVRSFLLDWTVPGMALLALLGWYAMGETPRALPVRRFATTIVALFGASLLLTIAGFDDGARPRYLSTILVPLALMAGPGWKVAADALAAVTGPRACRVVGVLVWGLAPIQLGAFLVQRTPDLWVREGLELAVVKQGITGGVVVVRALFPTRYARNGPFFDHPVLFVAPSRDTSLDDVRAAFPGRPVYEAFEGKDWRISLAR
jgi:hypothetical protein